MMNIDSVNISDETAAAYIRTLEADLRKAERIIHGFKAAYLEADYDDTEGVYRIPGFQIEQLADEVIAWEAGK